MNKTHPKHIFKQAVLDGLVKLNLAQLGFDTIAAIPLEQPADSQFGDYSSSIALHVFGKLSPDQKQKFSSPRQLAQALVEEINSAKTGLELSVAGPGFINLFVSQADLIENSRKVVAQPTQLVSQFMQGKKVIVEFTDPNPFKEFHIGHLYSNTVGEAISRLFEASGAEVIRACYQGDVGMHVAKSVWGLQQLLKEQKKTLADLEAEPLSARVKFLGKAYSLGATAYEAESSEATETQEEIKKINYYTFLSAQDRLVEEEGWERQVDYTQYVDPTDPSYLEVKELYITGRKWSLEYFNFMYSRVGMQFDDFFFESEMGEYGAKIVHEYLNKGVFEESQGAIIFPGEKYGLHNRVFINALGLPTYEAKELGLAPTKETRHHPDLSVIITGNEIDEYFKVLLKALSLISPQLADKTIHMSHGMVRLPEGKMSSRTGNVLTAEWLLDEAEKRAGELMKSVGKGSDTELSANEALIPQSVGNGAIKWAFLRNAIGKDISFSFDESLSFQGNSGPYLQYSLVRAVGVLQKVGILPVFEGSLARNAIAPQINSNEYLDIEMNSSTQLLEMSEKKLLRNLFTYSDVFERAVTEHAPHHLSSYLFELAQLFSSFYDACPIATETDVQKRALRLQLTAAFAVVLEHGLRVLNIPVVTKM